MMSVPNGIAADTVDLLDEVHVLFLCMWAFTLKCWLPVIIESGSQPEYLSSMFSFMLRNEVEVRKRVEDGRALLVVFEHEGEESRIPERSWMYGYPLEVDAVSDSSDIYHRSLDVRVVRVAGRLGSAGRSPGLLSDSVSSSNVFFGASNPDNAPARLSRIIREQRRRHIDGATIRDMMIQKKSFLVLDWPLRAVNSKGSTKTFQMMVRAGVDEHRGEIVLRVERASLIDSGYGEHHLPIATTGKAYR